jgi:Flp pilus assembly protein TadD
LLLAAAGVAAYADSSGGAFVLDDQFWIVENPAAHHLGLPALGRRMVAMYSLALNYHWGGLHVGGYHAVNLALHLLAGLTLWGLLRRTLRGPALRGRLGAAADVLAPAVALLWLVHPLQTQAVDYVVQRMEVGMALCYLLTLYAVARAAAASQMTRPGRAWLWGVAAWISCMLGMLTKEVMVTAPLLAIVYDRVFFADSWRELCRKRGWLYLALAATWAVFPLLGVSELTSSAGSLGLSFEPVTTRQYLLAQPAVILHYLRLVFWPQPLIFDYGSGVLPAALTGIPGVPGVAYPAACAILLGLLVVATGVALWRWPAAGFLGLAFFLILAPTSSLVALPDLCVEHRMYLPLAAVVALVVVGAYAAWQRLGWAMSGRVGMACGGAGAALILGLGTVMAAATWQRNADYRSSLSLWEATARDCPVNPRAQYNLGVALDQAGYKEDAAEQYQRALTIAPNYAEAQFNFANALAGMGRIDQAIDHYKKAVGIRPKYTGAHFNLANTLLECGRVDEAIEEYETTLKLDPGHTEARNNLGGALLRSGQTDAAIVQLEKVLAIRPDFAGAHYNLGTALAQKGRTDEAIAHFERALKLQPNFAAARYSLQALKTPKR